jgi:glycosyltransferase involved in cell wall biosynthesis
MRDTVTSPRARVTTRALTTLRNLAILARVGARHFDDDPALLAVQTLRRLSPGARHGIASAISVAAGTTSRVLSRPVVGTALAEFLADRPVEARAALHAVEPAGGVARRLRAELAVALGDDPGDGAPPAVAARAAWRHGHLTEAIEGLPTSGSRALARQRARLEAERRILPPGFRLDGDVAGAGGLPTHHATPCNEVRALHLLTNSLPWTQSGYSLRSHAVLRAQQTEGIAVVALTRVGYPVTVGLPHAPDIDVVDSVTYRRLVSWSLGDTVVDRLERSADLVAREATRFGATVLHTTTHYPNALVASRVAAFTGLPWVYEVRGQLEKTWVASLPPQEQADATASERYRLWHEREAELAREADHVVTISRSLRDDLVARGVPQDRITIVPNAVDDALVALGSQQVDPADARGRLGLPEAGWWVGTVTSVVDYEGLDLLIEAVALLRRRGLDVRCAIVGDGVARAGLVALTRRLGLEDAVVLPGRVPREQAHLWHRALDTFVVPRRDLEVCRTVTPLKPIEAMALGRPVVVSDLPALSEIAVEPGSGLSFRVGDIRALVSTLHTLHADRDMCRKLSDRGRAFAATRTWSAQASAYRGIYERIDGRVRGTA